MLHISLQNQKYSFSDKKTLSFLVLHILFVCVQVVPVLALGLMHTIGNVLTNISLGKVTVSFTHTIKAMEPFFAVILSVLFLAQVRFHFFFVRMFYNLY